MQRVINSLLLTLSLVSCASDTETSSRYHDISYLELPPTLSATPSSGRNYTADDSRVERRVASTGLGEKVYLTNSEPMQLRIRYPIQKAWYALAQAIKQSNFKVTDYDRDKKIYYISSGGESSSGGFFSFFTGSTPKINYALSLKGAGNETAVMANLAADQEKTPENDPAKVLRQLSDIMHDELKLDYNGA